MALAGELATLILLSHQIDSTPTLTHSRPVRTLTILIDSVHPVIRNCPTATSAGCRGTPSPSSPYPRATRSTRAKTKTTRPPCNRAAPRDQTKKRYPRLTGTAAGGPRHGDPREPPRRTGTRLTPSGSRSPPVNGASGHAPRRTPRASASTLTSWNGAPWRRSQRRITRTSHFPMTRGSPSWWSTSPTTSSRRSARTRTRCCWRSSRRSRGRSRSRLKIQTRRRRDDKKHEHPPPPHVSCV